MSRRTDVVLVADVGGTHARFALCDGVGGLPRDAQMRTAAQWPTLDAALDDYLQSVGRPRLAAASLAIAAAPAADGVRFSFTNSPWTLDRIALARSLGLSDVELLNDFEALALALPWLAAPQLHAVRTGPGRAGALRAVLGPGTGLGVAALVPPVRGAEADGWRALAGEGGHVGFAPTDEIEIDFLRALAARHGRVSAERVLSGDGLVALHAFLAHRAGEAPRSATAAEITAAALAAPESIDGQTVGRFCAMLGTFAGDVALTFGAWDGVYLGGGILPRILPLLERSEFVPRFLAKGRMARCLECVPVFVVVDTLAALRGAAYALRRRDRAP